MVPLGFDVLAINQQIQDLDPIWASHFVLESFEIDAYRGHHIWEEY